MRQARAVRSVWFAVTASFALTASSLFGYAIGNGSGSHLTHQWITQQAALFYRSQFGASEIDTFLGTVAEFNGGPNNRIIEGAYDEDMPGENPWGQGATVGDANSPSLRHFWDHYGDFHRDHDDGFLAFDSAPGRAIKYFTGGRDLLGNADSGWTSQGNAAGVGIVGQYNGGNKGTAYYWLGHAAHLMQDLTVPAHSQNDPHLEIGGTGVDSDPLHDWADGIEFSDNPLNGNRTAAFNDVNATRYQRWAFQPAEGAVGRLGNPASYDSAPIRAPVTWENDPILNDAELAASVPARPAGATGATYDQAVPLYRLMLQTAARSDDYDSKDNRGQVDNGSRGDMPETFGILYNNWTRAELDEVADRVVPLAMRSTAELYRYFFSLVDPTPPAIALQLAPLNPAITDFKIPVGQFELDIRMQAQGSDPISGVDLDGYGFILDYFDGQNWRGLASKFGLPDKIFDHLQPGQYRAYATVPNGGGLPGTTEYTYFTITQVPEPTSFALAAMAGVAIMTYRRRPRRTTRGELARACRDASAS